MGVHSSTTRGSDRIELSAVLRKRVFAVLYSAETQSIVGDQLARVALSVLVFESTDSVVATALIYAATFVPAVAGSLLLAGIGDRMPTRTVMIGCEVGRAALFVGMAIPGLPLWALIVLLVVAVAIGPVFTASEVSRLAGDLEPEYFRAAMALRLITNQIAQVGGFALAGFMVVVVTPGGVLLLNAATFAASALLVTVGLPAERAGGGSVPAGGADPVSTRATPTRADRVARRVLWTDRELRLLVAMSWLAGFFVVPEGLAVPVGHVIGASTTGTGLLFASIPLGGAIGAVLLVRCVPMAARRSVASWMAIGTGLPLAVTVLEPDWALLSLVWSVSGALAAYQIEVTTRLISLLPAESRARLVGVIGAGLTAVQGIGVVAFGAIAQWSGAVVAVAAAGLVGSGCALTIHLAGSTSRDDREHRIA